MAGTAGGGSVACGEGHCEHGPTRNGIVVTAGGLLFVGTWSDRMLRAYDKDNGAVL